MQIEKEWRETEKAKPVPKTSDTLLHYEGPFIDFSETGQDYMERRIWSCPLCQVQRFGGCSEETARYASFKASP